MPIVMDRPAAMTFGSWLEQRLIDASMGPSEFARKIGVSPNTVSHWFNRGGKPYRKTCYAIAEALGVPVEEVLERAGHRTNILDRPDAVEPPQPKFSIRALSPEEQAQFLAEVAEARKLLQGIEQRWGISVQAPAEANTD